MNKIHVLVIDDSAFMRKLISDFLLEDERIGTIETARNGIEGLEKIKKNKPDVITLDVEMPIKNGIEILKEIMKNDPIPVIMLSSTTKDGADNTLLAMQLGAFDFIPKPSGSISLDLYKIKHELISKVILASQTSKNRLTKMAQIKTFTINDKDSYSKIDLEKRSSQAVELKRETSHLYTGQIICIGTSTGGPRALQTVLTKLPKNIPASILVVQHMPAGFTKSLAERLNTICEIEVKEAEDQEPIRNGVAYIAPGGYHLKIKKIKSKYCIQLDEGPLRNNHRPSVDVLFESVAGASDLKKIAVIMTGMGNDGSKGLIELKNKDQLIAIAESKETANVYGMPKAAVETKLVDEVQDVENIAKTILKFV